MISVLGARSAKRVLHKISTIQHPTKSTAMTNVNHILNYPRIWLAGEERTQQRTYRGLHLHNLEPSSLGIKSVAPENATVLAVTKPHHRVGFLRRPSSIGQSMTHRTGKTGIPENVLRKSILAETVQGGKWQCSKDWVRTLPLSQLDRC